MNTNDTNTPKQPPRNDKAQADHYGGRIIVGAAAGFKFGPAGPEVQAPNDLKWALHEVILELMELGGTTPSVAAEEVCKDWPDLAAKYGEERIEQVARTMVDTDLPEASKHYSALFAKYNSKYFDSQLPRYRVIVKYDLDPDRYTVKEYLSPRDGFIDFEREEIHIRLSLEDQITDAALIREMAHAATTVHCGGDWNTEMHRLVAAGAPVLFDSDGEPF